MDIYINRSTELNSLIDEYINVYCLIERAFTEKTIKNKKGALNRFQSFLNGLQLSLETCREYMKHLHKKGLQPSSVRTEMKIVKAFVGYLSEVGVEKENWGLQIKLPKVRRKGLNIISAKQAEQVIMSGSVPGPGDNSRNRRIKQEHRMALQFILRTGLRLSELAKLSCEDIDFNRKVFRVHSKGGNVDLMPVPQDMFKVLQKRISNNPTFKVTSKTLNNTLKRGCQRIKIQQKVTVHTLRHIFCTELLKNGAPLQIVSRLMRHSSVKITDEIYSHYAVNDLTEWLNNKHPLISFTPKEKQS